MEEVFAGENTEHLKTVAEENRYRQNVLQAAWFEHRASAMSDEETELVLNRIKKESPEQTERIDAATTAEARREIVMEDLVLSPGSLSGSAERVWFREVFLSLPEAKELLEKIEDEPEKVFAEMDRLFASSHH